MFNQNEPTGVLVIYTGGTIGSFPKDKKDPNSPLVPLTKEQLSKKSDNEFFNMIPRYDYIEKKMTIGNLSVRVEWQSLEIPIDSSNVSPDVWKEIINIIKTEYNNFEGFVILHGTDTMVYTASVLSFMIDNLNKPIIITGSQKPIGDTRSDAVQNLITSIEIAAPITLGRVIVPEVCIFFRNLLTRGCRTIKYSASNYEAFISPNLPPLGTADEHIIINEKIIRNGSERNLVIDPGYSPKVIYFTVAPGMDIELLKTIMTSDKIDGIILLTYGTGNAPTLKPFLDVIQEAINSGKIIVNISQCLSGEVEQGLYDVSVGLMTSGVVSGTDMTREAAYTKLCHLLGTEKQLDIIADKMQINLRGEQRQSIYNIHFGSDTIDEDSDVKSVIQKNPMVSLDTFDSTKIDKAFLRILGISLEGSKRGKLNGKVYINFENVDENSPEDIDNFIGKFEKDKTWKVEEGKESIILPMTQQAIKFIDGKRPVQISIVDQTASRLKWDKLEIAIYTNN